MEIPIISDKISTIASHTFSISNLNFSAATKSRVKTIPRRFTPKRRRTKPKSTTGGGPDDPLDFCFSGGDFININAIDAGYFGAFGEAGGGGGSGGGGGGGGGGDNNMGWNFNWEESGSNAYSDPAFDFVYEVLSWIVLSNCLHFAYKKVVRLLDHGLGETAREKVTVGIGITAVC